MEMKEKIKKISTVFILILIVLINFSALSYATNTVTIEGNTNTAPVNNQVPVNNRYYTPNKQYYDPTSTATDPEVLESLRPIIPADRDNPIISVSRKVLSILQLVGVAVGLIMLVLLGIKFIVAKDKPDIMETAKNYLFGAFCIFGATGILSVIQQLVNEFNALI